MGVGDISDLARALITEPAEDSGSDTASRYNFQHECAARHCFAMINGSELSGIVCEWHVDYVLLYRDGPNELVSVKHREPQVGPWPYSELWTKGGLATLYERWKVAPESKCRLVTNGSVKSRQDKALDFAKSLSAGLIDEYIEDVATRLHCGHDEARSFLSSLRIEYATPDRVTMRAHNIVETVEPALVQVGINNVTAAEAWDAVVSLVAAKSRDFNNRDFSSINLAHPDALDADFLTSAKAARRVIRSEDVIAAISPKSQSYSTGYSTASNLWVREPASKFVGRHDVLEDINDRFEVDALDSPALALVGMSGVGKSEVMSQYAWRNADKYQFSWWVRADSWESMLADLSSLAEELDLPSPDTDHGLHKMKQYFLRNRGLLLIDGAEALPKIIDFIPERSATRFLISSLDQNWDTHVPARAIRPLGHDDATSLLAAILTDASKEDVAALNHALRGLPLALKQAAAYIKVSGMPVASYSNMVHDRAKELLARSAPREHTGLTAALSITIERLKEHHQNALDLLRVLSYLASHGFPTELFKVELRLTNDEESGAGPSGHNPIEIALLAADELNGISVGADRMLNNFKDDLLLFDAVADLRRFSLADPQQVGISCHALTQAVVRQSMTGLQRQEAVETGAMLLNKVANLSPFDSRFWPHYRHIMPHFETIIGHLESRKLLPLNALMLYAAMSMNLGVRGVREASLSYARKSVTAAESLEKASINTVMFARTLLVEALIGTDSWSDALRVVDESIHLAKVGKADGYSLANLHLKRASILQLQGKLAEAISELDKSDAYADLSRKPDEIVAFQRAIRANRATLRRESGDARGAVAEFEDLVANYPEDASRNGLATLYSNLSLAYLDATDFTRALLASKNALDIDYLNSDGVHADAARDWNNAGLALLELNKAGDAAAAFKASLGIHARLSTRTTTRHLVVRTNLGRAQMAQEDFVTARSTFEEALAEQEEILGPEHRDVASTLVNLSVVYSALGLFGNAASAALRAIKIDTGVYGETHPELIADYSNMSGPLIASGQYRAALKWLNKAYKIALDTFGASNVRVGMCLMKMGICKYSMGDFEDGVRAVQVAATILDSKLGMDHPEAVFCRDTLTQMRKGKELFKLR